MEVGGWGYDLIILAGFDISRSTTFTVRFILPDGSIVNRAGLAADDIVTDTTQGQITYTTIDGDLPLEGLYQVQVVDTTGGANKPGMLQEFYANEVA